MALGSAVAVAAVVAVGGGVALAAGVWVNTAVGSASNVGTGGNVAVGGNWLSGAVVPQAAKPSATKSRHKVMSFVAGIMSPIIRELRPRDSSVKEMFRALGTPPLANL